jgi:hypothetical protein
LDDCFLGVSLIFSTKLVGGVSNAGLSNQASGNYRVRNLIQTANGDRPTIGYSSNLLAYGGFEQSNYAADWSTLTNAARSRTQAHAGTYSLGLTATTAGSNGVANLIRPAKPGQWFQGEFWYYVPSVATGGQLLVTAAFFDAGGNSLDNRPLLTVTNAVTTWTKLRFNLVTPAPAGTVSVNFNPQLFGVSAGTATAYLDDIILNLTE